MLFENKSVELAESIAVSDALRAELEQLRVDTSSTIASLEQQLHESRTRAAEQDKRMKLLAEQMTYVYYTVFVCLILCDSLMLVAIIVAN